MTAAPQPFVSVVVPCRNQIDMAVKPPSTFRIDPVTNEEARCEAR